MSAAAPESIDGYIAACAAEVQSLLATIRATIQGAAPEATETIAYGMPTFRLDGQNLIYFAAYKQHIGIYPVPGGDPELTTRLVPYQVGKGTLRFGLDQPLPLELIADVVRARARETAARAAKRQARPKRA